MHIKTSYIFLICLCLGLCSQAWAQPHPDFEPAFSLNEVFADGQVPASYSADEVFKMGLLFSECKPGSDDWIR